MKIYGYDFSQVSILSSDELDFCFEIIRNNLVFEGLSFQEGDDVLWKQHIRDNLRKDNYIFVLIKNSEKICGFVSLLAEEKLYLSEIQFIPNIKATRAILATLIYIESLDVISKYNEIYFYINKSNIRSTKTFTHLGGEIVSSKNNSNLYVLSRSKFEKYLSPYKK